MTWTLLIPKESSNNSIVKHLALGAIYVKPSLRKPQKTILYDHIAEVFNILSAKYGV